MLDPLTKLLNRRGFEEKLKGLFPKKIVDAEIDPRRESPSKKPPHSIALLMADVDRFKEINDGYGHIGGDIALQGIAHELKDLARENDLVAREGGEEFIVAFLNAAGEEIISRIPKKGTVYDEKGVPEGELGFTVDLPDQKRIKVTLSGSVIDIEFPEHCSAEEAWALIEAAKRRGDALLYKAKREGRNRILLEQPQPEKPA